MGGMKTLGTYSLSSFWEPILTFIWGGFWFVAVAFAVGPLFLSGASQFEFPIWLVSGPRYELAGTDGTWTVTTTRAQLETPHVHTRTAAWIAAVFFALGAHVLGLLRNVFRSLRDGSPFIAANARRLRRMGLMILGIEARRLLVTMTLIAPIVESLEGVAGSGWRVDVWPSGIMLFMASVILILAEVFRRGTAMQDEQDLTV